MKIIGEYLKMTSVVTEEVITMKSYIHVSRSSSVTEMYEAARYEEEG